MIRIRQLMLLLCLAAPAPVDGAPPAGTGNPPDSLAWTCVGGGAGHVVRLEIHPSRSLAIAAGSRIGLCTTTDGGGHWRTATEMPPRNGAQELLGWDPDSAAGIFAGYNGRLFRSPDAGEHWSVQAHDLEFGRLLDVALVAGDRVGYACGDRGVFKTSDGGVHWRHVWRQPGPYTLQRVLRNRAVPSTLFAFHGRWVWRSRDAGASWQNVLTTDTTLSRLLWHRQRPLLLLAAADDGALYRSDDGGTHWGPAARPAARRIALAFNPAADDGLYAGASLRRLFVTRDAGAHWLAAGERAAAADPGEAPLDLLEPDPSSPGTLYAFNREGLFRTTDGGASWRRADADMSLIPALWVAVNPDRAGRLLIGGIYNEVARSVDAGASWDPVSFEGGMTVGLRSGAVAAGGDPAAFYIAASGGVLRSRDDGAHWEHANHGLLAARGQYAVHALAMDPTRGGALYVQVDSTFWSGDCGFVTYRCFKSTDGGDTWTATGKGLPNTEINTIVVDPTAPSTIYVATVDSLWRTRDGGASWTHVEVPGPREHVFQLVVAATRPATVLALKESGLFTSRDGGSTWQPAGDGLPAPEWDQSLAADPAHAGRVYAGTSLGVFVTEDGGGHWRRLAPGLAAGRAGRILSLAVDPRAGDLYAGTRQGVYVLRGAAR